MENYIISICKRANLELGLVRFWANEGSSAHDVVRRVFDGGDQEADGEVIAYEQAREVMLFYGTIVRDAFN